MDPMVNCPECSAYFMVVWNNDGFSTPEYCPMCGCNFDYSEYIDDDE